MTTEQPDLLFLDTFSHDSTEELNLDLVQFPKSVYVREIRIIPLGARVEGDFPGGVRLGATNPTKFHIDFFVNDLSKPGASTFEALGSLDYCQNGQIHMECGGGVDQTKIPTDGLVLRGCYTTITLAVYGNLTQVVTEAPVGSSQPNIRRSIPREVAPVPNAQPQATPPEWNQEPTNPIPTYTGNVAASNPDTYGGNSYPPENYDVQMYRGDYYDNEPPKDPRTYHHVEDADWEKGRRDHSIERDGDRLRHSPRSIDHERDRERRDGRSRRRSLERVRSRDSSRHRDFELRSRSRSRERDYVIKGEYRPLSRSRSRSIDRERVRGSVDRDWDRGSYKKDDYRRRRSDSYDRSRGGSYDRRSGSYEPRSPYDKRAPSYERRLSYEKRGSSYEKRLSPYDRRGSSYERRAPSYDKQAPYDKKRHSPYSRVRTSSYGSRSPSRDDPRKRPRSSGGGDRRPLSPREGEPSSPIHSVRSDEDYEREGKQIPRVEFYHKSYRHKGPIRSPSQELEAASFEPKHSSLVTIQIVDNPPVTKTLESPDRIQDEDKSMDAEQFEPILSDEDICDDMDGSSYMDTDYDVNEYCGVDDIIKYFNPFKAEWEKYNYVNKIELLSHLKSMEVKHVRNASFEELCDTSPDLFKISEMVKTAGKRDQLFNTNTFADLDNAAKEDWVHQCEQLAAALINLGQNSDIILRIFENQVNDKDAEEFADIHDLILTFCKIGMSFDAALAQQQPTYKIRHIKSGIRLVESLFSHKHNGKVMISLLNNDLDMPMLLLEMYSKEYMALSIRLMILKTLNFCLSSKESIKHFMKVRLFPKFDKQSSNNKPKNGYQALISIMQTNPLARIKFSLSALIKKLNMYELLEKLHDLIFKLNKNEPESKFELSEKDTDFIINSFEEILNMYRSQCFHISQPKRFLPVSAQFDINKDCSNEILLQFFDIHKVLESCLCFLTCPATCNNLVLTSPIHDLIYELVNSRNGLEFLYRNMELSEILFKWLTQSYGQQNVEEFVNYPHDLSSYSELQILGLEIAYKLKALYYLQSIRDIQAGPVDDNELIDRLQALYCLTFGNIGRTAVPDVIVMGENAECLMEVFEKDVKGKKSDTPSKQKSPAKGYAIELIAAAVRFSSNVQFLKKYGQRLITVCREYDRFEPSVSSVLQEVIPYLKPIEKASVIAGDEMAECVEILKNSLEHAPDAPGELTTCLRILQHYCICDYETNQPIAAESATEEYVELKYKYNVLQLFSLDGMAHLVGIIDRLVTHFEQPSMHTSLLASVKGLQVAQIMLPCLRLIDRMLARVVKCRGSSFRDTTAAPILLKAYGLAKTFPNGAISARTASRAAEAAVRALLAYTQPIADDGNDGDSIRRGPWTALCSEVISYTMTAPYTFVPGLLAFSELLPLPLPMQTRTPPSERELEDACNERKMWSAHLHGVSNELGEMIRSLGVCGARQAVLALRRVCVQLADLAPPAAALVAKAALSAVAAQLRPAQPATPTGARVLGFLACLVSHAPVKCAVLHALNTGSAPAMEVLSAICSVLRLNANGNAHAAAQEFAAHALAAFCDAEVGLVPSSAPLDTIVANSLPNKDILSTFLEATADCLQNDTKTCAVTSSILRAYFVLTEHEHGFKLFKCTVIKKREAFGAFFKWVSDGQGEEKAECLSLYLDLIKVLKMEEGEGPLGRKSMLTLHELADMVGYSTGDEDHPAFTLENVLKERNSDEEAISNASFLASELRRVPSRPESPIEPSVPSEPPPSPAPLTEQFSLRGVYCTGAPSDERLTAHYWLDVPSATQHDELYHKELVSCDIASVADAYLAGCGGAVALNSAVRRLAGCLDHLDSVDTATASVSSVSRIGGVGTVSSALSTVGGTVDAFRSRAPNTSRPPSLHVDDFTALHQHPYTKPNANRGMRRGGVTATDRGRFATSAPMHYRQLRGRGAWEMGAQHFGHFAPTSNYMMGGMGWGGARMQRGVRHRTFMR